MWHVWPVLWQTHTYNVRMGCELHSVVAKGKRERARVGEGVGRGVSRRLSLAAASETSKQTNAETTNS